MLVQYHFHHVGVGEVCRRINGVRGGAHHAIRALLQLVGHGLDQRRVDQGLIALYVHDDVIISQAKQGAGFCQTVAAGGVVLPGQDDANACGLACLDDAGIVCRHHATGWLTQRSLAGNPGAATWLSELIWREFYFQILANFPHVATSAFRPVYDAIAWEQGPQAEADFQAWCEGRTGYPLVDAAMLQLHQTGYMHNRLRMVAGSFLVKSLGIDWRWGERYFAQALNDFDLAANNGGWQWVASSGCDAQPWFRIFNPITQSRKFDPQGRFIRRYLPQLAGLSEQAIHAPWLAQPLELAAADVRLGQNYPHPRIVHEEARARTLARYAVVRQTASATATDTMTDTEA